MSRILVVEDNPSILKLSRDLLASEGYEVATTSDPDEVVGRVQAERPQLVLMDVQLPGVCGLDLARQLKSSPLTRDTVILAFTALAMKEDEERAMAAGCDGYVSKPIEVASFLAAISGYLGRPSPAAVATATSTAASAPMPVCADPIVAPAGERVLLIDDNPAMLRLLEAVLATQGYHIVTASDGTEGLAEVTRAAPDLVITDVSMPGLSGYDVCRSIKQNPETRLVPVVMLTAYGDSEKKVRGLECGADDFIDKPFVQTELLARVRSLIRTKLLTDQLESAHNVILSMARVVEAKDQFTWGHTDRVSRMAVELGQAAGLQATWIEALHFGGVLHDVGKIEIPDAVLNKPGPLDDKEWELMRRHPQVGAEIIRPLKSLRHLLPLIEQHHERLDGSGYPNHIGGDGISQPVRILSIVDVYDALTNRRSYKPAFPVDRAVAILREEAAEGRLDSELTELFIQLRRREQ